MDPQRSLKKQWFALAALLIVAIVLSIVLASMGTLSGCAADGICSSYDAEVKGLAPLWHQAMIALLLFWGIVFVFRYPMRFKGDNAAELAKRKSRALSTLITHVLFYTAGCGVLIALLQF